MRIQSIAKKMIFVLSFMILGTRMCIPHDGSNYHFHLYTTVIL